MTAASIGVQLALVGPLAAAVVALVLGKDRGARSMPSMLMLLGAAAAGYAGFMVATGHRAEWRGFELDTLRAVLAAVVLLSAAASLPRMTSPHARAAASMFAGLAAGSIASPDILWLGLTLVASTAAAATLVATRGASWSSLATLAVSDALVVAGFVGAAGHSLELTKVGGFGAWLVLLGGVLRLVVPARGDGSRSLVYGASRTQGMLLCIAAAAGSRSTALLIIVAAGCAAAALWRRPRLLLGLLVAGGVAIGGAVGIWGAIVAVIAVTAGAVVEDLGADAATSSLLALAPAAGSFLAAALVAGGALRLGAARPEYIAASVGILAGVIASAPASYALRRTATRIPSKPVSAPIGLIVLATLGVLAFAPTVVRTHGLSQAAASIGVPTPLGGVPEMPGADTGIVIALLAAIGFALGGVPSRRQSATAVRAEVGPGTEAMVSASMVAVPLTEDPLPQWEAQIRDGAEPRAYDPILRWVAGVGGIAAVGLAVALFVIAGGRGWL